MQSSKIVVTGCCGTIGSKLIEIMLAANNLAEIVGIDNNESLLFFQKEKYKAVPNVTFLLCDIRNTTMVSKALRGAETVFHCAAYKHVHLCEVCPDEALSANIDGLRNMIDSAVENRIETFVFTSSDKAVNPTNIMGASKLLGERLVSAAAMENPDIKFISTRFGNVLGSNGSVVEIFNKQISAHQSLTVTDFSMTRFVMTDTEAVNLLLQSASLGMGGEVFVTKMPVIKIFDLAVAMKEIASERKILKEDLDIVEIGSKPGEKLYEELTTSEETRRTFDLENFFCVAPAFSNRKHYLSKDGRKFNVENTLVAYSSENQTLLSIEEIKTLLIEGNLF